MSPKARKRAAGIVLILSVIIGWPVSWFLPKIDPVLSQQVLMWISFLALSIGSLEWWTSADVRAEGAGEN